MLKKNVSKEHKKSINAVLSYILNHLNGDVSLGTLSQVANYSPFHLQKVFKEAFGESPKQYITRLRLETAAHHLLIYPQKSISEIAYDCGYSSPAVFARAFKNYFKITAEDIRALNPKQQLLLRAESFHLREMIVLNKSNVPEVPEENALKVEIRKIDRIKGISVNYNLNDADQIAQSFSELIKFAGTHDLLGPESTVYGLIFPHQDRYSTFLSVHEQQLLPKTCDVVYIREGKYATFKTSGGMQDVFRKLRQFNVIWLPASGYKIASFFGFESFSQNPVNVNYPEIERTIFIPVEPV